MVPRVFSNAGQIRLRNTLSVEQTDHRKHFPNPWGTMQATVRLPAWKRHLAGVNGAGDTGHVNSAVYHGRVKSVAASRTDLQDIVADRCGSARSDSQ